MAKFELNQRVRILHVDRQPQCGLLCGMVDMEGILFYTVQLDSGGTSTVEGKWLRHEEVKKKEDLLFRLRSCNHEHFSLTAGDLHTCFDCGATRRTHEAEWAIPTIWRDL